MRGREGRRRTEGRRGWWGREGRRLPPTSACMLSILELATAPAAPQDRVGSRREVLALHPGMRRADCPAAPASPRSCLPVARSCYSTRPIRPAAMPHAWMCLARHSPLPARISSQSPHGDGPRVGFPTCTMCAVALAWGWWGSKRDGAGLVGKSVLERARNEAWALNFEQGELVHPRLASVRCLVPSIWGRGLTRTVLGRCDCSCPHGN
jgi:hypothetical protein